MNVYVYVYVYVYIYVYAYVYGPCLGRKRGQKPHERLWQNVWENVDSMGITTETATTTMHCVLNGKMKRATGFLGIAVACY